MALRPGAFRPWQARISARHEKARLLASLRAGPGCNRLMGFDKAAPLRHQDRTVSGARRGRLTLLDHLGGDRDQQPRHSEAEHLGGPEVDYHLEFGRELNRQIAWLVTA